MKVINKGVFEPQKDKHYHQIGLIPIEFDILGREMWLRKIQHIKSYMVGSSNYTTDYIEHWNLIFQVNTGIGDADWYIRAGKYIGIGLANVKPYLRPLSSMTEDEVDSMLDEDLTFSFARWELPNYKVLDFLNSHHFDYRGLIEKGLALEAPEGMYNIKD